MPRTTAAQQPTRTDVITGRVIAQDSTPIPMARVRAKAENGRELEAVSDSAGRYVITIPDGSGTYALSVRALGYAPFTVIVQRPAPPSGARIERDLRLRAIPIVLPRTQVTGQRAIRREGTTPGERSERWDSFVSEALPIDPGNFADVAALEPGVIRGGAGGNDLSIAGQAPDQNRTTVDGASYSGGSLPAEGVRSTGVISNTYDVSRGQFTGGQLVASTIAGTNIWGGALTGRLSDPSLRYGGSPAGVSGARDRAFFLSGGGGGPVVRDRLLAYGALDLSATRSPARGLELLDSAAFSRLQLSPDSARRFLDIAQSLGAYSANGGAANSRSDQASALARLDYSISRRHSLTARADWRGSNTSGLGSSPLRVSSGAGEMQSRNGGLFAQLSSSWARAGNEFRVYRSSGSTRSDAPSTLPSGQVRVTSDLANGAASSSFLGFGGTSFSPSRASSLWEVADELVIGSGSGTGSHNVKAGFLAQQQQASVSNVGNLYGSFTFNSLDDLERGRPASFTRGLARPLGTAEREYGAVYLGDTWNARDRLGFVYGLRLEGSRYGERPAPTAAVDSLVQGARVRPPSELILSPRFGFRLSTSGRLGWTVDGGIGRFAGAPSLESLAPVWGETGVSSSALTCIGPAAPTPDWRLYATDPASIPSACADGTSIFSSLAPTATLFSRGYGSPRTWRASLGVGKSLTPLWGVRANLLLSRGSNLPTAVDRNLLPSAGFTLPGEDGRPVYVGPASIDAGTGGIAPGESRINQSLGTVRELDGRGESRTGQLTAGVNGNAWRRTLLSLSYTFTSSRLLAGGLAAPGAISGTTAGDPARLEWQDAPFAPRHAFQLMVNSRLGRRLRVSAISRFTSGAPFTPVVRGDINGDGVSNDRAFVFDPLTTGNPVLARNMARLLDVAPSAVRDCLREQAGRIAAPGSCRTPWSPSLDFRAELLAVGNVNSRRLILTLTGSNVTAGLDYLLHGPNGLRGWGQFPFPDPALLEVRGFDPARRAFNYVVNPRFGQPLGGGLLRLPFTITLQGRLTLGADPRYQPLMAAIEAGMGNTERIRARLAERILNVPAVVLQLAAADTTALGLTLPQRARLQAAADSLGPRISSAIDSLAASYIERGPMTAARKARLQDRAELAGSLAEEALKRTREILTPAQWARLPAWLLEGPNAEELQRPTMEVTIPGTG